MFPIGKIFQKINGSFEDILKLVKKITEYFLKLHWKSPRVVLSIVLACIFIFSGGYYLSETTSAVNIIVNGQELGYVSSKSEAKKLVEEVLSAQAKDLEVEVQTEDEIIYKSIRVPKEEYQENLIQTSALLAAITPYIEGSGLKVNDKIIAVLPNDQAIEEVLSKFIEYQSKPSETNNVISTEIEEKVEKTKVKVNPQELKTIQETLDMLIQGDITVSDYRVEQDDSLWLIARKNNMLTDEILTANPNLSEDSILQLGQVIQLSRMEPFLTVISKGERVVSETIPFDVETKRDNSLGYGKSVVKQAGKDGEKEVTYSYVEENGKLLEKTVIQEKVTIEPVKQVVAEGPARPIAVAYSSSRGSGRVPGLIWPIKGRINSYYGYRNGEFHTGLDIDGDTGQPYVAAAPGKVIIAGWGGNYGYTILIDHGNGVTTRYAHSSKLAVYAGQQVDQGQVIGYVGSTGRSSGPHVHLEVMTNNKTLNPLNHL